MKIAVVGCGAMGSVYAGLLAAAGNEVWAVDVDAAHIAAINANGLEVSGASGERVVRVAATLDASEVGPCDMVVIATKAMQVEAAARSAAPMLGRTTVVLAIQNGLGSVERVAAVMPGAHVAVGVAGGFGASIRAPGRVHHNGWELVRFGEQAGLPSPELRAAAEVWSAAGFRVRVFDDAEAMVWEKLICNVCFSGTCALTGLTIGGVMATPPAWDVARGCAREAFAVATALGINVDFDDVDAHVAAFGRTIPNARPSMLLDHLAGRPAEIDVINGAIPPRAVRLRIAAPINRTVVGLLKARETLFLQRDAA